MVESPPDIDSETALLLDWLDQPLQELRGRLDWKGVKLR
jgi:hypothetical protein